MYKIASRKSKLAMRQTEMVIEQLLLAYPNLSTADFEIVTMETSGDKIQDRKLAEIGGKGLFTKELEDALLDGRADFAVHSLKDMPAKMDDAFSIDCILKRDNPRDAFVSLKIKSLDELPKGAIIGTSSSRRQSQILALRPDLQVVNFRGNINTRLAKLESGVADAAIMACAGIERLQLTTHYHEISDEIMLPAVAQGAICIQYCQARSEVADFLRAINDEETRFTTTVERAFLNEFEGSCKTPIGGFAVVLATGDVRFRSLIGKPDGSQILRIDEIVTRSDALNCAIESARKLKKESGVGFW